MCQADVGKVVSVRGGEAVANYKGRDVRLNVELLDGVGKGDYVVFSGGVAIERVERKEAHRLSGWLRESER